MPRTKRKCMIRRTKKFLYPAAGFQSDIECLLQKFVETKSLRFEMFVQLWRDGNYSLIHAGRTGLREKREFLEEAFKIVSKFALPPYNLQVRVGALYTLYSVYHTQRHVPKIKVRIPLACWRDIVELHEEVITHKHLDVDYVIRKMKHDGVFEFVAYHSQMTVEDLYECEDDDEIVAVNDSGDSGWHKTTLTASSLLDEDSLGQLSAVHDKYHLLKCQLHALRGGDPNTPSSSLDLIRRDLVDSVVELAQGSADLSSSESQAKQFSISQSAPPKKQSEDRASRVKEIKQRAQAARANTTSSALRYLNTSPTEPVTSSAAAIRKTAAKRDRSSSCAPAAKQPRSRKRESPNSNSNVSGCEDDFTSASKLSPLGAVPRPTKKSKQEARSTLNESNRAEQSGEGDVVENQDDASFADDRQKDEKSQPTQPSLSARSSPKSQAATGKTCRSSKSAKESSSDDDMSCSAWIQKKKGEQSSSPAKAQVVKLEPAESDGELHQLSSSQYRAKPETGHPTASGKSNSVDKGDKSSAAIDVEKGEQTPSHTNKRKVAASSKKRPKAPKAQKVHVPNASESRDIKLQIGSFVALKPMPDSEERPLVAKILSFTDSNFEAERHFGNYLSHWFTKAAAKKIRNETIARDLVLLSTVQWTKKNKLTTDTTKALRAMYEQLDSKKQ